MIPLRTPLTTLLGLALLLAACSGGDEASPLAEPTITTVSPQRISREGDTLTITGENFFEVVRGPGFTHPLTARACGVSLTNVAVVGEERTLIAPPARTVTIRRGSTLTGTLAAHAHDGSGDVTITSPDGHSVTLANAVTCYDPAPTIDEFAYAPLPTEAGAATTLTWTTDSPDARPLTCTLDPGDGSEPITIGDCAGDGGTAHTYTNEGSFDATLTVTDDARRTTTSTLRIGVGNAPPTIDSTPGTRAAEGQPYRYDVTAHDADGDALTLTAPTLPAWLAFDDHGDGSATVEGVPPAGSAALHDVVLVASDGTSTTEQAYTIETYEPFVPAIPAFAANAPYAVGTLPWSVATPDLNEDGAPDLAVVNGRSDTISVLINTGDGTFAATTEYEVDVAPRDVDVADMNADGNLDLLVSTASGFVDVLLGAGDGTLAPARSYPAGESTLLSVVAADLDGDGDPDVAVAAYADDAVSVLLNDGDGILASPTPYAVGAWPRGLQAADVNGDGRIDLIDANQRDSSVSVLINDGDGTFEASTEYAMAGGPLDAIAADFDDDGAPDLATASSDGVTVFLNRGNGTFTEATDYTVSDARQLAALDVGDDGILDLVTTIPNGAVSIFVGNGDGTFAEPVAFPSGPSAFGVATADLDGDGHDDVVATSLVGDTIHVHLAE